MKHASLALAVLLLASLASHCPAKPPRRQSAPLKWTEFTSAEANFKATFPGKPTASTESTDSVIGKIEFTMYMVELSDELVYLVAVNDYPEGFTSAADPDAIFAGAVQGMASSIHGKITSQSDIELAGYPGKAVAYSTTEEGRGFQGRARIFLVGDRLYQLQVLGTPRAAKAADCQKFLDSFELLPATDPGK